ncbi:MAG TPA: glycosyltransferase [Vicinamibacterales bacterium]|nr:glycosyltransferase [Vicinamibacterales bacterium]
MSLVFPPDVDVAIVAHNARGTVPATLDSLWRAHCPPSQVTIVDVASTDGTAECVRATWPEIRQIRLNENLGPSPGRNQGILQSRQPFVFLMDADVMVEPGTVQVLKAAMDADPRIAIGSPVVVHADRPDVIQYAGTGLHFICEAVNPWLDRPLAERGHEPLNIGVASTCGLLIHRQRALEYGLFDERYFIGKEDGDFTHRAVLAGYQIRELPQARVLHRSHPRGTWLFYYQIRNRWHFMLKNYEVRTLVFLAPTLLVHETLQAVLLVLKGHGWTYLKAVAGLIAMLPALPADRARVRRIRAQHDAAVLRSDPMVMREDLAGSPLLRRAKTLYERLLTAYWRLLVRTVLPR